MARYAARLMERELALVRRAAACYHAGQHGPEDMAKTTSAAKKRDQRVRMLIVEARFYNDIADALLAGATRVLDEAGAQYDRITVPGALEIPAAIAIAVDAARRKRAPYDGVVALGCVIQGETYHFEFVANESARGLMDLAVAGNSPSATASSPSTPRRRRMPAPARRRHKGGDAARAALAMVKLKRSLAGR